MLLALIFYHYSSFCFSVLQRRGRLNRYYVSFFAISFCLSALPLEEHSFFGFSHFFTGLSMGGACRLEAGPDASLSLRPRHLSVIFPLYSLVFAYLGKTPSLAGLFPAPCWNLQGDSSPLFFDLNSPWFRICGTSPALSEEI